MALVYYDEVTAERLFEQTFIKWLAYDYKGCYSQAETRRAVRDARAWAWRSKTARDLMNEVEGSPKCGKKFKNERALNFHRSWEHKITD